MPHELMLRLGVFVGLFVVFALLERIIPKRIQMVGPVRRWITNWAIVLLDSAALRIMEPRGYGKIVNIGSIAGISGQSFHSPHYSASKGGLMTLTKNVANAFARDRIRCNGILTGWMETPGEDETQRRFHGASSDWVEQASKRLPMGQLVQPDQLAGLVAYVASPEAGVMTGSLIEYDQFVAGAYPE